MTAAYQSNSWSVPQWVAAVQLAGRSKGRMTLYLETLQGVGCQKTGMREHDHRMSGDGKPREMWRPSMRKHSKRKRSARIEGREQRHADAEAGLHYNHSGCSFVAVSKAGLTNHRHHKHTLSQVAVHVCLWCTIIRTARTLQPPALLQ